MGYLRIAMEGKKNVFEEHALLYSSLIFPRKWLMLLNMVAFELAAAWLYLVCTYVSPCLWALKSVHVCLELLCLSWYSVSQNTPRQHLVQLS